MMPRSSAGATRTTSLVWVPLCAMAACGGPTSGRPDAESGEGDAAEAGEDTNEPDEDGATGDGAELPL